VLHLYRAGCFAPIDETSSHSPTLPAMGAGEKKLLNHQALDGSKSANAINSVSS